MMAHAWPASAGGWLTIAEADKAPFLNARCARTMRRALQLGSIVRSPTETGVMSKSISDTSTSPVANPGLIRPPRIFLAAIVLGIVGHVFWPVPLLLPVISIPAGAVLVVAAIGLFVGATRAFKAAGTPVPGVRWKARSTH